MRSCVVLGLLAACSGSHRGWLSDARVVVDGVHAEASDCRTQICVHNENTDLTVFDGATYLVHRTATSQILGPNSSLRVLRSIDHGNHWRLLAVIPAPDGRDLRDPSFYEVDGQLAIKALTRRQVVSLRDRDVDTIAVASVSSDGGQTWSPLAPIGPERWSFWRIRDDARGVHYTAAYEDGDRSVQLFSSRDGTHWADVSQIYGRADDTPLETELVFVPSGKLLALVRLDGNNAELFGNAGRLRTKVCWAAPPFLTWDCSRELPGVRLDGPVAFFEHGETGGGDPHRRLFVVARKHLLEPEARKRTALYELTGDLDGGDLAIVERGELPSAGDTAYAGIAPIERDRFLVTWYSSDLAADPSWLPAALGPTDIWQATLDLAQL
jgi:hypothetical protein